MYKVTVLISVYEASVYIDSKLASIERQSIFDKTNFVFINCQDRQKESKKIIDFCREFGNCKHIMSDKYITLYEAWNIGIKNSDSEYITNYNMDDQWHPDYLKKCAEFLDNNKDVAIVYSKVLITDTPNQLYPYWHNDDRIPFGLYPHYTAGPCPMWRRSLHDTYGYYDDNYYVIGDAKLWEKYLAGGEKFGLLDEDLVLYYRNSSSLERRHGEDGQRLIDIDRMKDQ